MDKRTKEVLEAAMQLPASEREILVELLIPTLEGDQQEAQAAWADEIRRRLHELDTGRAQTVPWEEVKRAMAKHIRG